MRTDELLARTGFGTNKIVACGLLVLVWAIPDRLADARPPEARRAHAAPADSQPRRLRIQWTNVSLRAALRRLSAASDRDIFLDRRLDPGTRVTHSAKDATVREILEDLAEQYGWGLAKIGTLAYVGSAEATGQLPTLVAMRSDDIEQLPAALRTVCQRSVSTQWSRLTPPAELVAKIASEHRLRLAGSQFIPHDLWPAGRMPPLSLAERLSVVLAGFDLTFHVDARSRTLEIVPIKGPLVLSRTYRIPSGQQRAIGSLQQRLPNASVRLDGNSLRVEGSWEDHQQLQALLAGATKGSTPRRSVRRSRQVFTLRVQEQPLDVLLRQLAERIDLDVTWDRAEIEAAGLSLQHRVSFEAESVDIDGLLKAALQPAGLTYHRDGRHIRIRPK